MERKNDSTILLLLAAGLGIYWYYKSKTDKTTTVKNLVTEAPIIDEKLSTQPVYDQNIAVNPINEQIAINEQKATVMEYTPVTDMFNSTMMTNYVEKNPIDAVYNMNIQPIE